MPHCFANGCKNHSDQNPFVTFHAIPKDPALVKAWAHCCSIDGVEDLVNSVLLNTTEEYYLCSEHIDGSTLVFSAENKCLSSEGRLQQVNYESESLPMDVQPDHLDPSVQTLHSDARPQQVTRELHLPSSDCRPQQVTHGPQSMSVDSEPQEVSHGSPLPAAKSESEHTIQRSKPLSRDCTLQKATHDLQSNPLESTPHQGNYDMQHIPVDIKSQQVILRSQLISAECAPQQITPDPQNLHLDSKPQQNNHETQLLPLGCHPQHKMHDSTTTCIDSRLQAIDHKSQFLLPDHSPQCDNHNSQCVSVACKSQKVKYNTPSLFMPYRAHLLDHDYQSFSVDYSLQPEDYESQSMPVVCTQQKTNNDSQLLSTDCGSQHNNHESHSPSMNYQLQHMKHTSLSLSLDSKSQLLNHDSPYSSKECRLQPTNHTPLSLPVDGGIQHVNQDSQSLLLAYTQHQMSHGTKSLPMDCTPKKAKYESHLLAEHSTPQSRTQESPSISTDSGLQENSRALQCRPMKGTLKQVNRDVQVVHKDCSPQQKMHDSYSFSVDSKCSTLQQDSQSLNMGCKPPSMDHNYQSLSVDCSAQGVHYNSQSPIMDCSPKCVDQGSETISMNYSKQYEDHKSKSPSVDSKLKALHHEVPTPTIDCRLSPLKLEFQSPSLDSRQQSIKCESQSQNASQGTRLMNHKSLQLSDHKPLPINDQSHSLSTECRPVTKNLNSHSMTTNRSICRIDDYSLILSKDSIPKCMNHESLSTAIESKQQSADCEPRSMTIESSKKPITIEAQHHSQDQEPQILPCKSNQLPKDGAPLFIATTSEPQSKDNESSQQPIDFESQSMSVKRSHVSMDQEPQSICFESSLQLLNGESQSMDVTNRQQCMDVELQSMYFNSTEQSMYPKPQCMPKDTESQCIPIETIQLHQNTELQSLPIKSGEQLEDSKPQSITINSRPQSMDIESQSIPVVSRQQPMDVESQFMSIEARQQSIDVRSPPKPILSRQQSVKADPDSMPIKSRQQPLDGEPPSTPITAEQQSIDVDPQSMPIEHTQQPLAGEIQPMPIASNQQPTKNSLQPIYSERQLTAIESRILPLDGELQTLPIGNGHQIDWKPQFTPIATAQPSMDAELQPMLIENRQQATDSNLQSIPINSRHLPVDADFKSIHTEGREQPISGEPQSILLESIQSPVNCDPQSTPIENRKQSVHLDGELPLKPSENKHQSLCNEPHFMDIESRRQTIEFESLMDGKTELNTSKRREESTDPELLPMHVEIRQQGIHDEHHSIPMERRLQPIDSQPETIAIDGKCKPMDLEPEDLPSLRKQQTMDHNNQIMLIESRRAPLKPESQNLYVESKQVPIDGGSQSVSVEGRQQTVDPEPKSVPYQSKLLTVDPAHRSIEVGNRPHPIDDEHQCMTVVKEPQALPFDNSQQSMYQESHSTPIKCKQELMDLHPQSMFIESRWKLMGSGPKESRLQSMNPDPQSIPLESRLQSMNPDPQSILVETRPQPKNLALRSIPVERRQQSNEPEPQSLYMESRQQPHDYEAKSINVESRLQPVGPESHSLSLKSKMPSMNPEPLSMHLEVFEPPILDHQYMPMDSRQEPMHQEPQTLPIENRQVLASQKPLSAPIKCKQQDMDLEPQPVAVQSRLKLTGMCSGSGPTESIERSMNPDHLCLTMESGQQVMDTDPQPITVESRQQLFEPDPQIIPCESKLPTMDPEHHPIHKENRQQPINDEQQTIPMDSRGRPTVQEPQAMAIENTPQPMYQEPHSAHIECKQQLIHLEPQPITIQSKQNPVDMYSGTGPIESSQQPMNSDPQSLTMKIRQLPLNPNPQPIPVESSQQPMDHVPESLLIKSTQALLDDDSYFKLPEGKHHLEPESISIEGEPNPMEPEPEDMPIENTQQPLDADIRFIPIKSVQHHEQSEPQSSSMEKNQKPEDPELQFTLIENKLLLEDDSQDPPIKSKQQPVGNESSEPICVERRQQPKDHKHQPIPWKNSCHPVDKISPQLPIESREPPLTPDHQSLPLGIRHQHMDCKTEYVPLVCRQQPVDKDPQFRSFINSQHPVNQQLQSFYVPFRHQYLHHEPEALSMDCKTENVKSLQLQSHHTDCRSTNSQQRLKPDAVCSVEMDSPLQPRDCTMKNLEECSSRQTEPNVHEQLEMSTGLKRSSLDVLAATPQHPSPGLQPHLKQEQKPQKDTLPGACPTQCASHNMCHTPQPLVNQIVLNFLEQQKPSPKENESSPCASQCTSQSTCHNAPPVVKQIVVIFLEQQKDAISETPESPLSSQCTAQTVYSIPHSGGNQDLIARLLKHVKHPKDESQGRPCSSSCTVHKCPSPKMEIKQSPENLTEQLKKEKNSVLGGHDASYQGKSHDLDTLVYQSPPLLSKKPVDHSTPQQEKQQVETFLPTQDSLESTSYSEKPWEEQTITFEDIAIRFSKEEWESLEDWQKTLYKDVMKDNYDTLLSIGCPVPKPGILSWIHQQHYGECDSPGIWNERETSSRSSGVSSLGGNVWLQLNHEACEDFIMDPDMQNICAPSDDEVRRGTHLSALMKLVKEIPEFLFGGSEMTSSPSPAGSVDEKAWPKKLDSDVKSETTSDSSHLPVLEDRLTELWSAPNTPSSIVQADLEESRVDTRGKRPSAEVKTGDISAADNCFPYLTTCLKQPSLNSSSNSSTPTRTLPRDHEQGTLVMETKNAHEEELHTSRVSHLSGPVAHLKDISPSTPKPCSTPARTSTPSTIPREGEIMRPESGSKRLSGEQLSPGNAHLHGLVTCLQGIPLNEANSHSPAINREPASTTPEQRDPRRPESAQARSHSEMVAECSTNLPALVHGTRVSSVGSPGTATPSPAAGQGQGELGGGRTMESGVKRSSTDMLPCASYLSGQADYLKKMPAHVHNAPAPCAPPSNFVSIDKEPRRLETGVKRPFREDPGPGKSPLHGLVNCLNDISAGRLSPNNVTASGRRGREWRRPEVGVRRLNEAAEAAPGTTQLPALMNCLKKTPVQRMSPAQMPGASLSPRQRESRRTDVGMKRLYDDVEVTPSSPSHLSSLTSLSKRPPVNHPSLSTSSTSSNFSPAFRDPQRNEMDSNRHQPNEATQRSPSYSPGFMRGAMIPHTRMPSPVTSSTATGATPGFREMRRMEMANRRPQLEVVTSSSSASQPSMTRSTNSQLGSTVTSTTISGFNPGFRDPRRVEAVNNRPYLDVRAEIEASNAHLQSLANCWKEIPAYRHSPSQVPNTRGAATAVLAEKEVRRPDVGTKRSYVEAESPPDLANRLMKKQFQTPSQSPTSSRSSPSMSPGGRDPRRPEREVTAGNTHLHGLMNCLKDIPLNRPSMPSPASSTPPHVASGKAGCIGFSPTSSKAGSVANSRYHAAVPSSIYPTSIRHDDGQQRRPEIGGRRVNPDGSISTSVGRGDEEQKRLQAGVRRLQTGVMTGSNSEKHLQEVPSPQHDNRIGTISRHDTGSETSRSVVNPNQGLKKWCRTGTCLHPVKNPGEDVRGQSPVSLPQNPAVASSLPRTEWARDSAEGRIPSKEDREKMIHHHNLPHWLRTSKTRDGVSIPGPAGDASGNSHLHGLMKLTRHLPVSESNASSRTMQEIARGMVDKRPIRRSQVAFFNEASPLRDLNDSNAGSGDSVISDDTSWSSENAEPSYSAISRLQKVVSGFSENECISPFTAVKPSAAKRSVQEAGMRRMCDHREAVRNQDPSSTHMPNSHCIDLTEEEELARMPEKPVHLSQAAESESRPSEYNRNVELPGPRVSSSQCIDLTEDEDMVCEPPKAKTFTPVEDKQGSPAPENMISPVNRHLSGLEKLLKEVPMMELGNFSGISNKYGRNVNWKPKNSPSSEPQEPDSHISEKHSNI
ncbi:uncharacterized protein LOC144783823 isoform X1 [Lissotriton helveticus]